MIASDISYLVRSMGEVHANNIEAGYFKWVY